MAKDNLITNTFRLNMNNPTHVKINNVLKNLNPKIYKSRNQFLIDAAVFFIEHYGDESFMERKEVEEIHFVTQDELEVIKKEMIQNAMTEARREVIRLLGGVIAGAKSVNQEVNNNITSSVPLKAVDSTGAESPWAAIVFFVMDSNGSGGMMLTGPDSTIMENGIDGATITKYTFTVPPVSGHSGQDYGRVRGYNIKTGAWDQLDYGTTSNGISFTRTLTAGIYSKLEMYYYTNHSCMYNKSNITYTVEYYFE